MKSKRIRMLYFPILSTATLPLAVISCSNQPNNPFVSDETNSNSYGDLWNLSFSNAIDKVDLSNSLYEMTLKDFESKLNEQILSNRRINKLMKIYCFQLLYQAIKNPYDSGGHKISNLGNNLTNYGQYLLDKINPDNPDVENKKYNNFDKFLDNFKNIKINVLSFKTFEPDPNQPNTPVQVEFNNLIKLGNRINDHNNLERLNFQISFEVSDPYLNEKIINEQGETIFYKTNKTREQRQLINKYKNNKDQSIYNLIDNQFLYQGTKMYYEVPTKTFKTIVLNSNVKNGNSFETKQSGFIKTVDTNRNVSFFDFKEIGKNKYRQYFVWNLANSSYFDTSLSSNFTNYLTQFGFIKDSKMEKVEFNFNKYIYYNKN